MVVNVGGKGPEIVEEGYCLFGKLDVGRERCLIQFVCPALLVLLKLFFNFEEIDFLLKDFADSGGFFFDFLLLPFFEVNVLRDRPFEEQFFVSFYFFHIEHFVQFFCIDFYAGYTIHDCTPDL